MQAPRFSEDDPNYKGAGEEGEMKNVLPEKYANVGPPD